VGTVYANQEALEGTVTTTVTLTLARKSRAIEIINDSGTRILQYKFNSSENWSTLKPVEAISFDFITREILLNSPSSQDVLYRVRALG